MAEEETNEELKGTEKSGDMWKIAIFFLIVGLILGYYYLQKINVHITTIYGVEVNSDTPVTEISKWDYIALYNNTNVAATTCNFELIGIKPLSLKGHKILIEQGKNGIYIRSGNAYIRGEDDLKILNSCHVFACLLNDIKCPDDFSILRWAALNMNRINLVIDESIYGKSAQGIIELQYALGAIQAMTNSEENIYLKNESSCTLKIIRNITGLPKIMNETRDCNIIPRIYIGYSDKNQILVDKGNIFVYGNDDHLYNELVIVRDVLAPDLREKLQNLSIGESPL